jgi:hypothetical protein
MGSTVDWLVVNSAASAPVVRLVRKGITHRQHPRGQRSGPGATGRRREPAVGQGVDGLDLANAESGERAQVSPAGWWRVDVGR